MTKQELIDMIVKAKPTAEVENDEGLYATPRGRIDVDGDGLCSLTVTPCHESLDAGNFRIEVDDVEIIVTREADGPGDDWEFYQYGSEIDFEEEDEEESDEDAEDPLIAAIMENVDFPEYDGAQYESTDFDPCDVENSICVDKDAVFAKDGDGNIYQYKGKTEIRDGQTEISAKEAIHSLVEQWSDDGGESDEFVYETGCPWC